MIDKNYCMSHFLAFRFVEDENINFFENLSHKVYKLEEKNEQDLIYSADDIERVIKRKINENYIPNKTAIFLSGGIDSAILASYLPKGTPAYTFKCIAPNAIDETKQAKKYCDAYDLEHRIVEIHWSDFEDLTPELLEFNQTPFHSIQVQLLKAIRCARQHGIELIILGDSADRIFGGLNKILSKDWDFEEFIDFYTYVNPKKVLKNTVDITKTYEKFRLPNNKFNSLEFITKHKTLESTTSYMHTYLKGNIKRLEPYSFMKLAEPLDIQRIRNGEPKYLLRELFARRYPNIEIPNKIPMPRPMEQWLRNYKVTRPEFIPNCTANLTGDQKWLVYCLEQFLNKYERG